MTATGGWCIHGIVYWEGWFCPQCARGQRADAQAEADRLRGQLDAAEADRLVEAEATIARLREAVGDHGQCTCRYTPGYPRGDRHAPGCDHDPDLLAAFAREADR